jgi:hypothetical protein
MSDLEHVAIQDICENLMGLMEYSSSMARKRMARFFGQERDLSSVP